MKTIYIVTVKEPFKGTVGRFSHTGTFASAARKAIEYANTRFADSIPKGFKKFAYRNYAYYIRRKGFERKFFLGRDLDRYNV